MKIQDDVYKHFHPDERNFIDKMWEWLLKGAQYHEVKVTDFLDPRQSYILSTLANRMDDVHCLLSGGYPEAERKRAVIGPDYLDLSHEPTGIQVISITSEDARFPSLDHGDFLGSLLGLGIKREKVGDIHVFDQLCHVVTASEIAEYIHLQLQQVHRVHVYTEMIPIQQLLVKEHRLEEIHFSVASMRLDGIVSDVYRISRAKVLAPIKSGKCKVNWKVVEDPSFQLSAGDVISFKGFGRFKIIEAEGLTKKGRIRLTAGKVL
jgi:RNA-binding protein YlmH